MKHLQPLLILLTISCAIFSCQKEYSVENNTVTNSASAQWSFTEGTVQFKGPIDTVAVDTLPNNSKILSIRGHSSDNRDEIALEIFAVDLKPGTYKIPYCLFAYMRSGVLLYQTHQTLVDSFTIIITKLDSTGITGSFRGKAFDTASVDKNIVEGKFSAVFKSNTPVPPASTDSGQVVLWSKAGCGGGTSTTPINVSVGSKNGQITQFISSAPTTCDPPGTFSIKLPVGTYPMVAKCGTDSITGMITVVKNGCVKVQIDFSDPQATGDYFPVTPNSNWSYLYQNSSADDTLYTFSTGNTTQLGGKTYNIFTNTDGVSKDSSYYRKSGNTYFEYVPGGSYTDSTGVTFTVPSFEYRFLIDNLAASSSFSDGPFAAKADSNGIIVDVSIYLNSTILATGASVTVGTQSNKNVIEVKTVTAYKVGGISINSYAVEQWFQKGVGLIRYIDYAKTPFTTPSDVLDITRSKVY